MPGIRTTLLRGGMVAALAFTLSTPLAHGQEQPEHPADTDTPSTTEAQSTAEPESDSSLFVTPDRGGDDPALAELAALSREASALGEELATAREELADLEAEAEEKRAEAEDARKRADEAGDTVRRSQDEVDSIAQMRYRGGGSDLGRAALMATSPRDLLDRMGLLSKLSGVNLDRLEGYRGDLADAVGLSQAAEDAADAADEATRAAEEHTREIEERHSEMQDRMRVVEERVDALDAAARAIWTGSSIDPADFDLASIGPTENREALVAAMSRTGAPYSWGATGPDAFDCSGLMVWAYNQTGKSIPRTSQMQAQSGRPVSTSDMQAGDLVIYFPGATHVGMYAGNGLVLHASTYGVPVGLDPVDSMPIHSVRRY